MADAGWWELVLGWLACWRLTRLVTADTLLEDYRAWADDLTAVHSDGWRGRLAWAHANIVTCPWCLSVYVAAVVLAGLVVLPRWLWVGGALICGWSALAAAAEVWVHRD